MAYDYEETWLDDLLNYEDEEESDFLKNINNWEIVVL